MYLKPLQYKLNTIQKESPLSQAIIFNDKAIDLSNGSILQFVDSTGLRGRSYYLRVKVSKIESSSQVLTVQLVNTSKETDNIQVLKTVTVDKGQKTDFLIFDIVISPKSVYNRIEIALDRNADDYNIVHEDRTCGRIINMEVLNLSEINNVIDIINTSIDNKGMLKQIGVQGPSGMQMCIDGEEIRIGKSGIYEINNGIIIKFIGFIVEDNDNKKFILDYQY